MRALLPLLLGSLLADAQGKTLPRYSDKEAAEHAGEEAVVTGKVVAVTKSQGGTTYLNFGERFPREVFSAVVLARDAEKVGDVKQFEGKTVAVTGRIELMIKKAQIVLRAPGQVVVVADAGASEAEPPMVTTLAPVETKAGVITAPKAAARTTPPGPAGKPLSPSRKIVLGPGWDSPAQGGAMTRKDLATVFAGRGKASAGSDAETATVVWADIPYLTPLAEVKKRLKLEGAAAAKNRVATPGMPIGSFWNHTFTGVFEGGYNRLCLITDLADQLVSLQLVEDAPRLRSKDITNTFGFHTYDFISGRSKGAEALIIKHEVTDGAPGVVVIESTLINPNSPDDSPPPQTARTASGQKKIRKPGTGEVMEMSKWFVPAPVAQLILRCAEGR